LRLLGGSQSVVRHKSCQMQLLSETTFREADQLPQQCVKRLLSYE
jgi:hypothetical protein